MDAEESLVSDDLEVVLAPPGDPEFERAFAAALERLGGRHAALAGPRAADRVQEAIRASHPHADVLYEAPDVAAAGGRARWTIYRDGADAA